MDSVDLFRIFLRVAENGSFVRAAESLNRPASTVSAAVQALESRLGTRLFHRTTRSVSLTIDGNAFYTRCQTAVQYIEETENLFRSSSSEVTGTIRVDVPGRVGSHIIIPALPSFSRRHPAIKIELGVTDRNVNLAEEGIDCAVRVGQLENSGMVAKRLGYLSVINVASAEYIAESGRPATPGELCRHYSVGYASPTSGRKESFEWIDQGEVKRTVVNSILTVNSAEASIAACIAGMGILQIPAYDVSDQLSSGILCELMPEFRPRPLPVSILYPHRRHLSRPLRLFTDWLAPLLLGKMNLSNDEN
ncbi:LysR family transcriptional regulator (plasmid) [Pantoea dispersa]|uniref:LysR family transcriptional regulator n=1 Tax=Pantoea dispersa TaxID=59814 RepID=A0ABY2ZTB5_9GAMM|nr:LysR family transcriptional regulator [Pantoea dispersa]TQC70039.1 LysR family transcriptional regulator [Pantoea dispersa]